jgi:hypothetical protein
MKKAILTIIFSVCFPFLIFGSAPKDFSTQDYSLKQEISKPPLRLKGTKVYKGTTLLTKDEVLNILSATPSNGKKYEKGTRLRGTGVGLIIGGAATFIGGIALAVSGIETITTDTYYYNYTSTDFTSKYYIGLAIGTIGELMVDGGIACSIIGKTMIRRSVFNYNETNNQSGYIPGLINYQFGLLDNGKFGLELTF